MPKTEADTIKQLTIALRGLLRACRDLGDNEHVSEMFLEEFEPAKEWAETVLRENEQLTDNATLALPRVGENVYNVGGGATVLEVHSATDVTLKVRGVDPIRCAVYRNQLGQVTAV